jgi:fibronectin type 3 domain-containing protein
VDLYYVVRAESDETCSTGPSNGGVLDGNLVERGARDTLGQPLPAFIDTVLVQGVNDAHVRLEWLPVPDVVSYRIYRSESADMSGSFLLDETEETVYEDVHELGTAKTYYYRVQGVNACGQE